MGHGEPFGAGARDASRRSFLRLCAAASGALTPVVARGLRGATEALAQTAPKKGGTLRVGFYIEAATMDPHLSGSKIDRQVYHNIYEPLVVLDNKLASSPAWPNRGAARPEDDRLQAAAGRQVPRRHRLRRRGRQVQLRPDAEPETKSVRTGEIANVQNAEVVDKYTVKLNLKRPDAALLATLTDRAGMMISPEAVKKFGADLQRNPVGTGPFQFVEWVKDDHLAQALRRLLDKEAGRTWTRSATARSPTTRSRPRA